MNKVTLLFTANEQSLVLDSPMETLAEGTVNYVEAYFTLGENWDGFDSVRAVWTNGELIMSTVLSLHGYCTMPTAFLQEKGIVEVNLVGSVVENDILTDRLTTKQAKAVVINKPALFPEEETITPSQFEQFVAEVKEYRIGAGESAEAAAQSEANAATSEANASASEQAAKASELNAAASELAAKASEDNAAASESHAATSEANALASEQAAKASEQTAVSSAASAALSAGAALTSEQAAKESELSASASKVEAKTSEINALASEQAAKASELAAASSEANASASETNAAASAASAAADADRAEIASANAGFMFFDIDDNGYLQYTRTANTEVDFYLDNGDLFVTDEEVNNGN
jgi:hypothetical protein